MSNPRSRKCCVVPKCTSTTTKMPDKLFFLVPMDLKIRKKWINAMKRLDPLSDKSMVYCCEDHFDRTVQQLRKLYENLKTRGKHQLLVTEILSTLHAPGKESQESSPNQAPVNQGSELLASDSDKLCAVPVILGNPSIACGSVAALCRTTLKRAFLRNITIKMTRKAFSLRKRGYDIRRQREQQLHNLRVSTQKWLGKATEEKLKKIKLDRVLARLNGSAMLE